MSISPSESAQGLGVEHESFIRSMQEVGDGICCPNIQMSLADFFSSTCNVWFDISRKNLPRPFRVTPVEDAFKQIRAERKWFKNVRLFPSGFPSLPSVVDESGYFSSDASKVRVTQMGNIPECNRKDHGCLGPRFAPNGDLPSFSNAYVSPELASEAITAIADIFEVSVSELREISTGPPGIESLGLDSLTSIEIIYKLTKLGVKVPTPVSNKTEIFVQEIFECFLESFIMEYGDT